MQLTFSKGKFVKLILLAILVTTLFLFFITSVYGSSSFVRFADIDAGDKCSAAVDNEGTVWTWGYNLNGVLGQNYGSGYFLTPMQIAGLDKAQSISVGNSHMITKLSNRTLRAWGDNAYGQLGNSSNSGSFVPVEVGNGNPLYADSVYSHY